MRVGFSRAVIRLRNSEGWRDAGGTPSGGEMRGKGERTAALPWRSPGVPSAAKPRVKRDEAMTGPIETYRVEAHNTAKSSENKIHDDAVARRFGFGGGLVPGVDVMAYMMHLPIAKWGRAFLERGLIEARFVKPVYDGEITNVTATETDGVLSIEVESRGELC